MYITKKIQVHLKLFSVYRIFFMFSVFVHFSENKHFIKVCSNFEMCSHFKRYSHFLRKIVHIFSRNTENFEGKNQKNESFVQCRYGNQFEHAFSARWKSHCPSCVVYLVFLAARVCKVAFSKAALSLITEMIMPESSRQC